MAHRVWRSPDIYSRATMKLTFWGRPRWQHIDFTRNLQTFRKCFTLLELSWDADNHELCLWRSALATQHVLLALGMTTTVGVVCKGTQQIGLERCKCFLFHFVFPLILHNWVVSGLLGASDPPLWLKKIRSRVCSCLQWVSLSVLCVRECICCRC